MNAIALLKSRWTWIALGAAAFFIALLLLLDAARDAGRAEIQAQWDAEKAGAAEESRKLSAALAEAFNGLDGTLQNTVRSITAKGTDITVRVRKELDDDPRYSDPRCDLSGGVLDEINAARSLSRSTTPADVGSGTVSPSGAAVRIDLGEPRPR